MSEIVDLKKYKIIGKIGKGSYGVVHKVEKISNKKVYAAKVSNISFEDDDDGDDEDEEEEGGKNLKKIFSRELHCHQTLDNEAVIKFHGYSLTDFNGNQNPVILTEFMERGNLLIFLNKVRKGEKDGWNNTKMIINIIGIALGMKYLHDNGIIHRDLKPENILLDKDLYPKLIDFGTARYLDEAVKKMTHIIGTALYMAPEIAEDDTIYTFQADVFSFAMILYELYANVRPSVKGRTTIQVIRNIGNGSRPDKTKLPEGPIRDLVVKCWSKEPNERPTFDDIIHYYIENKDDFWPEDVDEEEVERYLSKFGLSLDPDKIVDFFLKHKRKESTSGDKPLFGSKEKKPKKKSSSDDDDIIEDSDEDSDDSSKKKKSKPTKKPAKKKSSSDDDDIIKDSDEDSDDSPKKKKSKPTKKPTKKKSSSDDDDIIEDSDEDSDDSPKKKKSKPTKKPTKKKTSSDDSDIDDEIRSTTSIIKLRSLLKKTIKKMKYVPDELKKPTRDEKKIASRLKPPFDSYYERATEDDDKECLYYIATQFIKGNDKGHIPKDRSIAYKYMKKAAELGNANAMYGLGYLMSPNIVDDDDDERGENYVKINKIAVEFGNELAAYVLGYIFQDGFHVEKNYIMSLVFYKYSADKKFYPSMFTYANHLRRIANEEIPDDELEDLKEKSKDILNDSSDYCTRSNNLRVTATRLFATIEDPRLADFVSRFYYQKVIDFDKTDADTKKEAKKILKKLEKNAIVKDYSDEKYRDLLCQTIV